MFLFPKPGFWPIRRIPLAWLMLSRQRLRLVVALAGIGFAGLLMFMQFGFKDALFESSITIHRELDTDLVLISPQSTASIAMSTFPERRLYQALSFPEVTSIAPMYWGFANWRNPETRKPRSIQVMGIDPNDPVFLLPSLNSDQRKLQVPEVALFDEKSRAEFGPIPQWFKAGRSVTTEVGGRRVRVVGLFPLGASFGADGNIVTSDLTFLKLFPDREKNQIDIGLIKVRQGTDLSDLLERMKKQLPPDVRVLSKQEFEAFERDYWANSTAIGFIFTLGAIMGFVVGGVVVYQILYSDVSDHLAEYATLKAMGYSDLYLLGVVFQEALLLAFLGYIPGFILSAGIYHLGSSATNLPLFMTIDRALLVFSLTLMMCGISGAIAVRRLKSADPAEIF
jgi:putative ABC transport system permease protein